ncbi:MAG: CRISPR-associated endonuclease Cas1, partial [Actinobacteria bacterium]|nr:CRISPR-associated endonuclease Cas1 [Actinomycetota bacterium]
MKRHLNTLFVTTQGAYLSKDGETVTVKVDNEVKLRVPIHTVGGIVCFGNIGCSPYLMGFCGEQGVSISFLTEYGKFLAKVQGPVSGNVLLRREQYRRADNPEQSANIARMVLLAKIANSRAVLRRLLRDHASKVKTKAVDQAAQKLTAAIERLQDTELTLDTLRGIEGETASTYFGVFDNLITAQKSEFVFDKRNRRPPLDKVNCLLSFVYT